MTNAPRDISGDTALDEQLPVVAEHVPMANRLSLVSWGDGSVPSMPSIDDNLSLDGRDSAVGSFKSSTISLRSSTYDFVEENGRTYHKYKEGNLQHALFVITTHGRLFLAPLEDNPLHVLDLATGTGIWAIEFAQEFPGAQVVGTDLGPTQPVYVPPNCHFEIEDAEDPWTFSQKFDYIHGRALLTCFRDPKAVFKKAFDALAPGGYFEMQDAVFPFSFASPPPEDCAFAQWSKYLEEGSERMGRPWSNGKHYKRWFEEIGFEDVVERRFYWPLSPWAKGDYYKTVASFFQEDLLTGAEGISLKVLGYLGWSATEMQVFLAKVKNDMRDTSVHAYIDIVFVYGRKPKPKGDDRPSVPEQGSTTVDTVEIPAGAPAGVPSDTVPDTEAHEIRI